MSFSSNVDRGADRRAKRRAPGRSGRANGQSRNESSVRPRRTDLDTAAERERYAGSPDPSSVGPIRTERRSENEATIVTARTTNERTGAIPPAISNARRLRHAEARAAAATAGPSRGAEKEKVSRAVPLRRRVRPRASRSDDCDEGRYLVDPASSHMLVSKIKPCMSEFAPSKGKPRMAQYYGPGSLGETAPPRKGDGQIRITVANPELIRAFEPRSCRLSRGGGRGAFISS